MFDQIRLSIIIPAFNEEERISSTVKKIWEYANRRFRLFEIVVVSEGSTDGTNSIVASLCDSMANVKLLEQSVNFGKGASIKKGVLLSSADLILTCDADLSTPIQEFEKLYPWIQRGFDVVIGSRALAESVIVVRQPWYREGMGRIFNICVQALALPGMKDTQCGFKLFKGDAARKIYGKTRINHFCSDVEALFLAKNMGYMIKEVPIQWLNDPRSKIRPAIDSFRMFQDLLKIRFYNALGAY